MLEASVLFADLLVFSNVLVLARGVSPEKKCAEKVPKKGPRAGSFPCAVAMPPYWILHPRDAVGTLF